VAQEYCLKTRGGVSLAGAGWSRKMPGRKIRLRRLSAIFLPGIFLLPPILSEYAQDGILRHKII
jgi:hypothetical protein